MNGFWKDKLDLGVAVAMALVVVWSVQWVFQWMDVTGAEATDRMASLALYMAVYACVRGAK